MCGPCMVIILVLLHNGCIVLLFIVHRSDIWLKVVPIIVDSLKLVKKLLIVNQCKMVLKYNRNVHTSE
jgi:hypothetical protein